MIRSPSRWTSGFKVQAGEEPRCLAVVPYWILTVNVMELSGDPPPALPVSVAVQLPEPEPPLPPQPAIPPSAIHMTTAKAAFHRRALGRLQVASIASTSTIT